MAAILFACTKNYKFLHSAHKISDAIIEAVELKVAGIGEYIQGRLKPPPNLPNLNQRPITSKNGIKGHFMSLNDLGQFVYTEYGAATMEVFSGKEDIEKTFFKDHGATKLMKM